MLRVVHLAFEGQKAGRRHIRGGDFDRLPVVALRALSLVITVPLVVMVHGGAAELASQFPLMEEVVRSS